MAQPGRRATRLRLPTPRSAALFMPTFTSSNNLIEAAPEAGRGAEAMKTLRATADAAQYALVDFARVLQSGTNERGEQRHAWCSACLKHSAPLKLDVPRLWEPAFYCIACGMLTSQCATPGCEHPAVRGTSPSGWPYQMV